MIIIFYKEASYRYGLIFYIKKKTGIWEAPVLDLILSDLANVRVFAESPLDKSHLSINDCFILHIYAEKNSIVFDTHLDIFLLFGDVIIWSVAVRIVGC